jgi:copper chaperone CopZ
MMDVRPALVFVAALLIACGSAGSTNLPPPRVVAAADVPADLTSGQDEVSMEIVELMCSPCAAEIVSKSRQLPGVTKVSMFQASKTLTVRYDTARTSRESVISSVEEIVATIQ